MLHRRIRTTIVALAGAALLVGCYAEHPKFKCTDITGAPYGKTLELTGHDGKPRTLADFPGKIVVLLFGFTHWPDVCPITLADVAQSYVLDAKGRLRLLVTHGRIGTDLAHDLRELLRERKG